MSTDAKLNLLLSDDTSKEIENIFQANCGAPRWDFLHFSHPDLHGGLEAEREGETNKLGLNRRAKVRCQAQLPRRIAEPRLIPVTMAAEALRT